MAEDLSDPIDDSEGEIDPGSTLAKLMAENAALKDQAMRYAAEAENIKRRAEREANDARSYAIQKFARDLLDAADNLARALQHAPKDAADPAVTNLIMGVEMTEKALLTAFERNGLKRVNPARGDKFDPNLHQAMMEQPADDVPPGSVLMVMQAGYELFGRIVRPALVAVSPKAAATPAPEAGGYAAADRDVGASVDAKA
jgi:molecular chaperone GrpE